MQDWKKFFDHYLKGVNNDWEFTPKARLCILNPGGQDIINRPEADFPLARQQTKLLHLDAASKTLSWDIPVSSESSIHLDSKTEEVLFTYTFPKRTELTGYFALNLYIEAPGAEDADIFCVWDKLSAEGTVLKHLDIDPGYLQEDPEAERQKVLGNPHLPFGPLFLSRGSHGRLRASHRELSDQATLHDPRYTHRTSQPLMEGEIVKLQIEMRPFGVIFEAGQSLQLTIAGHNVLGELPFLPPMPTVNKGDIVIYTGGKYDSALVVPLVE